jgi:hypothetical protein
MLQFITAIASIAIASAAPYDLIRKEYLNSNFLEVDFVKVDPFADNYGWRSITTTTIFPHSAVVFVSIPDVEGFTVAGFPGVVPPFVPKVKEGTKRNSDGTYTFEFKLVSVNDSYCSKNFGYNPNLRPTTPAVIEVAWMVAQKGAYSILDNETNEFFNTNFIIGSGNITRASADPTATNSNGNAIQFEYPKGCTSPTEICTVQASTDTPGLTPGSGSLQQLQTNVNKVDGNVDMFLSVRAWQVKKRSAWFVLVPHDSLVSSYFHITMPETLAYLIFPTNQQVKCAEGFAFETKTFTNVTHRNIRLNFVATYSYPPGVFGMIGSVISMVDSTTLSVYDRSTTGAIFVTKEDQCASAQTIHTTPETVHVMIFGQVPDSTVGTYTCGADFTPPDTCHSVKAWKTGMPGSPSP